MTQQISQRATDRKSLRSRVTTATTLVVASLLVGCAQQPLVVTDYCRAEGRRLPTKERISRALLAAYDDSDRLGLMHFSRFKAAASASAPTMPKEIIVASYLERNPSCCLVVQPWPIREYDKRVDLFGRNYAAETEYREITSTFPWTHDVLIGVRGSASANEALKNLEFAQSSCGDTQRFTRG